MPRKVFSYKTVQCMVVASFKRRHIDDAMTGSRTRLFSLSAILVATLAHVAATESSVVLTKTTFEKLTKGKTVFIKFFAPWCGHCQDLAPKWEKMASEWVDDGQGLVGQVDCSKSEDLCKVFDIKGLPTLLHGDPGKFGAFLEPYHGDKTYEALSQFANQTLSKPVCSPANLDACNASMRDMLVAILKLPEQKLMASIEEKEQEILRVEQEAKNAFKTMQTKYDKLAAESQMTKARIKDKIRMLKVVQEARA